ncbi:MAG: hypothetical protein O3A01_08480 [bacterium]|nr:hypothetical protein [bacterium]
MTKEVEISAKGEFTKLFPAAAAIIIVGSIVSVALNDFRIAYSIILGVLFSGLGFSHLAHTQKLILGGGSKKIVFIRYLGRLGIYALPVIIAVKKNNYFNLPVILISLFTFQVLYIFATVLTSWKRVRENKISN